MPRAERPAGKWRTPPSSERPPAVDYLAQRALSIGVMSANCSLGTAVTCAHMAWCPRPQNSLQGIAYSPGALKLVRTSATNPGTTMVFTLVLGSRNPCTTSALVRRNFTGVLAGTRTQRGTKSYC